MTAASVAPASALGTGEPVVRPVEGLMAKLTQVALAHIQTPLAILRTAAPIAIVKSTAVVTRYDDVKEVFATDKAFTVPYKAKLDVIMGGHSFFLGMGDTPQYRRDTAAIRKVVRREDILNRLAPAAEAAATRAVAEANGRIEAVGELVRQVTFEVLLDYFGTPAPAVGDLKVWATRLFEFQFADGGNDPALRKEVDVYAPALRAHVQELIGARKNGADVKDDVLGRCLAMQASGDPDFTDDKIRCALIGFIVGGLPQPPMVGPQALEQLLRRPAALIGAHHRLTKPKHPWTNGQVERMNRTIKEATVQRFYYDSHSQLRQHLEDFVSAYNYARRLESLKGLTPYEFICKRWTSEPERFIFNPLQQMPGLNI